MGTPWCVCRPVDLTYISLCLLLQVLPTVTANNLSILSSLTFHATPLFAELCNEVYLRQHSCHTLCSRAAYPLCSHSIYTSTQSFYWEIHTETATIIFFFFFLNNDGEKAWQWYIWRISILYEGFRPNWRHMASFVQEPSPLRSKLAKNIYLGAQCANECHPDSRY